MIEADRTSEYVPCIQGKFETFQVVLKGHLTQSIEVVPERLIRDPKRVLSSPIGGH